MFAELKNTRQFCDVLRSEAALALDEGTITHREYRQVRAFSRLRPRKTQDVMELVQREATAQGLVAATAKVDEIDWSAIAAFIKEILPVIIEFIQALVLIFA